MKMKPTCLRGAQVCLMEAIQVPRDAAASVEQCEEDCSASNSSVELEAVFSQAVMLHKCFFMFVNVISLGPQRNVISES